MICTLVIQQIDGESIPLPQQSLSHSDYPNLTNLKPNLKLTQKRNQVAQLVGLLLWRFGLALATAASLHQTSKFLLSYIDLPLQLEIGIGLIFSGAVIFMASLVMERVVDARNEGVLKE